MFWLTWAMFYFSQALKVSNFIRKLKNLFIRTQTNMRERERERALKVSNFIRPLRHLLIRTKKKKNERDKELYILCILNCTNRNLYLKDH